MKYLCWLVIFVIIGVMVWVDFFYTPQHNTLQHDIILEGGKWYCARGHFEGKNKVCDVWHVK